MAKLHLINSKHKIHVFGIDKIASYKFSILHLIELFEPINGGFKDTLKQIYADKNANFSAYYPSQTKSSLESFITKYELQKEKLQNNNTLIIDHIIANIKETFNVNKRENQIYKNYLELNAIYNFKSEIQFFRFGVFHILKNKINTNSSFFSLLIENKIYSSVHIPVMLTTPFRS
ncbi:MAG: hypothetical protein HYR91_04345 [Flavobacteriia bacterium]|nr:hypothetical protein [Flavobacteriia bacterium]